MKKSLDSRLANVFTIQRLWYQNRSVASKTCHDSDDTGYLGVICAGTATEWCYPCAFIGHANIAALPAPHLSLAAYIYTCVPIGFYAKTPDKHRGASQRAGQRTATRVAARLNPTII